MMKQRERLIYLAMVLFALGACSMSGPLRKDAVADGYTLGTLSSNWQVLALKSDADWAWLHQGTSAVMALQSVCHRYEHVPLKVLNMNVTSTLSQPQLRTQEEIKLDGRAALDSLTSGEMDGVPVEIRHIVLRKNHCIFDFTLTQTREISKSNHADFLKFVQAFRFEGGSRIP